MYEEKKDDVPDETESAVTMTPEDAAKQMRLDWQQGMRHASAFKENMTIARPLLIEAAKKTPGMQLLRDFPALNNQDIVSTLFFLPLIMYVDCSCRSED